MTSRQLRLVRGAAASSVATILAAVSHTIGGGTAPHPLLIVALGVFVTPIAALLVGSRPSLVRLSATVLLSQTVFHTLFVALNATATPTIAGAGHNHVLALGPPTDTVAADAGMLGAHIIAAVFTIALLWRGESLLRAIARWMRSALRARVPHLQTTWPVPASIAVTARTIIQAIRVGDLSRRGPPVFSRG
ncbi:hypothetical protein [Microbacterium sp.]|uniref:hypothetical protein n=1 Tax=Microbacterium sp. TaxID=51671 RepID=UPI003A92AF8D